MKIKLKAQFSSKQEKFLENLNLFLAKGVQDRIGQFSQKLHQVSVAVETQIRSKISKQTQCNLRNLSKINSLERKLSESSKKLEVVEQELFQLQNSYNMALIKIRTNDSLKENIKSLRQQLDEAQQNHEISISKLHQTHAQQIENFQQKMLQQFQEELNLKSKNNSDSYDQLQKLRAKYEERLDEQHQLSASLKEQIASLEIRLKIEATKCNNLVEKTEVLENRLLESASETVKNIMIIQPLITEVGSQTLESESEYLNRLKLLEEKEKLLNHQRKLAAKKKDDTMVKSIILPPTNDVQSLSKPLTISYSRVSNVDLNSPSNELNNKSFSQLVDVSAQTTPRLLDELFHHGDTQNQKLGDFSHHAALTTSKSYNPNFHLENLRSELEMSQNTATELVNFLAAKASKFSDLIRNFESRSKKLFGSINSDTIEDYVEILERKVANLTQLVEKFPLLYRSKVSAFKIKLADQRRDHLELSQSQEQLIVALKKNIDDINILVQSKQLEFTELLGQNQSLVTSFNGERQSLLSQIKQLESDATRKENALAEYSSDLQKIRDQETLLEKKIQSTRLLLSSEEQKSQSLGLLIDNLRAQITEQEKKLEVQEKEAVQRRDEAQIKQSRIAEANLNDVIQDFEKSKAILSQKELLIEAIESEKLEIKSQLELHESVMEKLRSVLRPYQATIELEDIPQITEDLIRNKDQQVQDYSAHIFTLKSELEHYESSIKQLNKEHNQLSEHFKLLEKKADILSQENAELRVSNKASVAKTEELELVNTQLRYNCEDFQNLTRGKDQKIQLLELEYQSRQQEITELANAVLKYQQELKDQKLTEESNSQSFTLKSQCENLQEKVEEMQIRIGKFEGDKKRLNSKVLELEDQKNDLESQIEDISSELEHERMQRKKIEELYEGSQNQMNLLIEDLSKTNDLLSASNSEIAKLHQTIQMTAEKESQRSQLKDQQISKLEQKIGLLIQQNETNQSRVDQMQSDLRGDALGGKFDSPEKLNQLKQSKSQDVLNLKTQLSSTRKQLGEFVKELADVNTNLSIKIDDLEEFKQRNRIQEELITELQQQITALQKKERNYEEVIQTMNLRVIEIDQENSKLVSRARKLEKERSILKDQLQSSSKTQSKVRDTASIQEALRGKLKVVLEDEEKNIGEYTTLKKHYAKLKSTALDLFEEISYLRTEAEEQHTWIEELQNGIENKTHLIQVCEAEIQQLEKQIETQKEIDIEENIILKELRAELVDEKSKIRKLKGTTNPFLRSRNDRNHEYKN